MAGGCLLRKLLVTAAVWFLRCRSKCVATGDMIAATAESNATHRSMGSLMVANVADQMPIASLAVDSQCLPPTAQFHLIDKTFSSSRRRTTTSSDLHVYDDDQLRHHIIYHPRSKYLIWCELYLSCIHRLQPVVGAQEGQPMLGVVTC